MIACFLYGVAWFTIDVARFRFQPPSFRHAWGRTAKLALEMETLYQIKDPKEHRIIIFQAIFVALFMASLIGNVRVKGSTLKTPTPFDPKGLDNSHQQSRVKDRASKPSEPRDPRLPEVKGGSVNTLRDGINRNRNQRMSLLPDGNLFCRGGVRLTMVDQKSTHLFKHCTNHSNWKSPSWQHAEI